MRSIDIPSSLSTDYGREELRVMHYTGRDTVPLGKSHLYREGVQTRAGDLELSEWRGLVLALIEREGGQLRLERLKLEARKLAWLHTENEVLQKALELYCEPEGET